MTTQELEQVRQAFGPLVQFLSKTHHDEEWHAAKHRYLAYAERQLAVLIEPKEAVAPEPEPESVVEIEAERAVEIEAKLVKAGKKIAELERQRADLVRQIGCDPTGTGLDPAEKKPDLTKLGDSSNDLERAATS